MKALPFKIPPREGDTFRVQVDELPHFYDRFHHHPEIQITWIVESAGTLLLGTTVTEFKPGDIFIIGPQLPHRFKNNPIISEGNTQAKSISIFFDEQSFGDGFFALPELKEVVSLLQKANRGIRLSGETQEFAIEKMKVIQSEKGMVRLLHFLSLLDNLSRSNDLILISKVPFDLASSTTENEKLEQVVQFVLENYDRRIKLAEVASVANLSVSTFCRFFKLRTRKTFFQFLNEFRISMAGKLLTDQEHSITEICYTVGFSNLSNFNRQFKETTGYTPSQYIKKYADS
jgi:AraC-like DNA-binding protein